MLRPPDDPQPICQHLSTKSGSSRGLSVISQVKHLPTGSTGASCCTLCTRGQRTLLPLQTPNNGQEDGKRNFRAVESADTERGTWFVPEECLENIPLGQGGLNLGRNSPFAERKRKKENKTPKQHSSAYGNATTPLHL